MDIRRDAVPSWAIPRSNSRTAAAVLCLVLTAVLAGCGGGPTEVELRITNTGSELLYVLDGKWLHLTRDGDSIQFALDCSCECGANECAMCGIGAPIVAELPAGASKSIVWGGEEWVSNGGCVEPETVDSGEAITATATFSYAIETDASGWDNLADSQQVTHDFSHPDEDSVIEIALP